MIRNIQHWQGRNIRIVSFVENLFHIVYSVSGDDQGNCDFLGNLPAQVRSIRTLLSALQINFCLDVKVSWPSEEDAKPSTHNHSQPLQSLGEKGLVSSFGLGLSTIFCHDNLASLPHLITTGLCTFYHIGIQFSHGIFQRTVVRT